MNLLRFLVNNPKIHRLFPKRVRAAFRYVLPLKAYNEALWESMDKYAGMTAKKFGSFGSRKKVGIIYDPVFYYQSWIDACIELKVDYEVLDLFKNNWIEEIDLKRYDFILFWPPTISSVWKKWSDEVANYIENELGLSIFPSFKEIWLFESKCRMYSYCQLKGLPIPKTWIFYNEKEAYEFSNKNFDRKFIFKSDIGAGSSGVKIIMGGHPLNKMIKLCFNKGFFNPRGDKRDRQWGLILIQEYIENVDEYRVIRIGDDFFCRKKLRSGLFHSGSGELIWHKPTDELLNLTKSATDSSDFKSMAVDIFVTEDNRLLINELQTVCGVKEINDTSENGRSYLLNEKWEFERGDFSMNKFNNHRIKYLLSKY